MKNLSLFFSRDDLIPEKGEFSAVKGLDEEDLDVLFSDSKFERRDRYYDKIKLIRENPSKVFKFLTDKEKERYNSFLEKTVNNTSNLDRLDSDFDWKDNIRQDYDIYEPKIDFDNPSKSDLLIILFHELHPKLIELN